MKKLLAIFSLFILIFSSNAEEFNKYYLSTDIPIIRIIQENKDDLEITMEQQEAIEAVRQEFEPQIEKRKKQINELENQLNQLILKGGDSTKIKEIIIKLAQLKAENTVLRIKEIRNIQNTLTKSQYKKILKLLEEKPI